MPSSCPLRSPTAIIWHTMTGNSPERLSGVAMDSPSRIDSRAFLDPLGGAGFARPFFPVAKGGQGGQPEGRQGGRGLGKAAAGTKAGRGPEDPHLDHKAVPFQRPFSVERQRWKA